MFRLRFERVLVLYAMFASGWAAGAVFTTKLQPHTLPSWSEYVERFERVPPGSRPMPANEAGQPVVKDLNPNGMNGDRDVPDGYIHHWIGAILIPDATAGAVRAVLENYASYPKVYAPEVKAASAVRDGAGKYRVRLVTEQIENFGMHFAFDMKSNVEYREVNGDTFVDSRSYLIRESDSGHAPYTDLMPEGEDHGIAWRLNSYWRLRQLGHAVDAECQVISLSRKPLFGTRDQIKDRARESMERTLLNTMKAAR